MKTRMVLLLIFVMLATGFAFVADATAETQKEGVEVSEGGKRETREDRREKLRRRVEMMVMMGVADELDLPAETEEEFLLAMRKQFRGKTDLTREMLETQRELVEMQKDKVKSTTEELGGKLDKLEDISRRRQKQEENFKEELKRILSVEQRARFAVVWPRVNEKVRSMLEHRKRMMKGKGNGMNGMRHNGYGQEPPDGPPPDGPPKAHK